MLTELPNIENPSKVVYPPGWFFFLLALLFIVVGAGAIIRLPEFLLSSWLPELEPELRNESIGVATQTVLWGLGGIIAVIGVALSLARHGQELRSAAVQKDLAASQMATYVLERKKEATRSQEASLTTDFESRRELNARFERSVHLLSSTEYVARQAGLYSIAAVVDEWRLKWDDHAAAQVAIDVLCSVVRQPELKAHQEMGTGIRETGLVLIRDRLKLAEEEGNSWQGFTFDLRRSIYDFDIDLEGILIGKGTQLLFSGSTFTACAIGLDLITAYENGRLDFGGSRFVELLWLSADFFHAKDEARTSFMAAEFENCPEVNFTGMNFQDSASLGLSQVLITTSTIRLEGSSWSDHATLGLYRARLAEGGTIDLSGATLHPNAALNFGEVSLGPFAEIRGKDFVISLDHRRSLTGSAEIASYFDFTDAEDEPRFISRMEARVKGVRL